MSQTDFQEVLRKVIDGESDDLRAIEGFLAEDESYLEEYLEQVELDALLRWELGEVEERMVESEFVKSARNTILWKATLWKGATRSAIQAAAVVGLALVAFFFGRSQTTDGSSTEIAAPVAVLIDSEDCVWKSGPKWRSFGTPFKAGETLNIKSGIARLALLNKAGVAISGPAELDLVSSEEVLVRHGSVSAFAPEEAIGFKVSTPDLEIVDLGTRFATSVAKDGTTDVHVFDGEVSIKGRESDRSGELITTGQARRYDEGGIRSAEISIAPESFEEPPELEQLLAITASKGKSLTSKATSEIETRPGVVVAQRFLDGSGELDGQLGGVGFAAQPWWASSNFTQLIPRVESHAGEFSAGGHLLVRGRDKAEPFVANRMARRLAEPLPETFFFAVRASYHDIDGDDFFALWLDSNGKEGSSHADVPSIGIRDSSFFARLDVEHAAVAGTVQDTECFLLAGRYRRDFKSGSEDIALWIDPSPSDEGSPDAEVQRPFDSKSRRAFRYLGLRIGKDTEVGDRLLIRGVSVATSLSSALTAVQE